MNLPIIKFKGKLQFRILRIEFLQYFNFKTSYI
jgi:hypothetical protein